jgi:hypothetical protein
VFAIFFFFLLKVPDAQPEDLERSFRVDSVCSKDDVKVEEVVDVNIENVDDLDTPKKDNRESLLTTE